MPHIAEGRRIMIHPASDYFMRGIRYADIVKIGRKWITLHSEFHGLTFRITSDMILPID